jgi:TPP-dependent pyruvate/acetoin dehydrogenase alpha subunit
MHRWMVLSRVLEDRLFALWKQGRIRGRLLTGRGQEAIPTAAALAVNPDDFMCIMHRDMAAHLIRGTTAETVMLHYFGKATGPSGVGTATSISRSGSAVTSPWCPTFRTPSQ